MDPTWAALDAALAAHITAAHPDTDDANPDTCAICAALLDQLLAHTVALGDPFAPPPPDSRP